MTTLPRFPALPQDAHKGSAGRVLCVAGSRTMPGAAVLVARAAQRGGAGLVCMAALDPELFSVLPVAAPEAVLVDAVSTTTGKAGALFQAREPHALLLGPGLGDDERARRLSRMRACMRRCRRCSTRMG